MYLRRNSLRRLNAKGIARSQDHVDVSMLQMTASASADGVHPAAGLMSKRRAALRHTPPNKRAMGPPCGGRCG